MSDEIRRTLLRQLDTAWMLASYHLEGLTTEECLWRPASRGLHVRQDGEGHWRADWPEHEGYDLGPPSIAWTTWHIGFWWSSALDHSFGAGTVSREDILWPGTADAVREWIATLREEWLARLTALPAEEWQLATHSRWPFQERPFADVVAWANIELTKNAAEIGYGRFLFGVRGR